jgi:hypothetical protein
MRTIVPRLRGAAMGLLLLAGACSNTGGNSIPLVSPASRPALAARHMDSVHSMTTIANSYSTPFSRPLDSYDDATWWANGGSGGLVSSSGSNCTTRCLNSIAYHGVWNRIGSTRPTADDMLPQSDPSTKAAQTRKPMTMGRSQLILTCWFQEVTPGVEDPAHDIPLGCTYEDFVSTTQDINPNGGGFDFVGIHGGKVSGAGCASSPETIQDPIDVTSSGAEVSVTDINVVMADGSVVGWMYMGSNGVRYYQPNYATQAAWNFNISLGIVSGGTSTPGGYGPVKPWTGQLPPGSRPLKCFTSGTTLVG